MAVLLKWQEEFVRSVEEISTADMLDLFRHLTTLAKDTLRTGTEERQKNNWKAEHLYKALKRKLTTGGALMSELNKGLTILEEEVALLYAKVAERDAEIERLGAEVEAAVKNTEPNPPLDEEKPKKRTRKSSK
jgi:septal ring factor EnvC (AmiA/AmiB activator)